MKPQFVELIVTLSQEGSIGAAAKKLNKTQPAITKALRNAEADLGTQIFHRVPHGIVPTVVGQIVIERCHTIDRDLKKLGEAVSQAQGDFVGTISIIVSPFAAMRIIPAVLRRYQARFPNIRLDIAGGHAPTAFHLLRTGGADIVIGPAAEPGEQTGLQSEVLVSTPISIISGASSRFSEATDVAALAGAKWVMIGPSSRRPLYFNLFEEQGLTPPAPIVASNSMLSILSIIESGDFLASFPSLLLHEVTGRWRVKELPIKAQLPEVAIALTTAKDRILTPAALSFVDILREQTSALKY